MDLLRIVFSFASGGRMLCAEQDVVRRAESARSKKSAQQKKSRLNRSRAGIPVLITALANRHRLSSSESGCLLGSRQVFWLPVRPSRCAFPSPLTGDSGFSAAFVPPALSRAGVRQASGRRTVTAAGPLLFHTGFPLRPPEEEPWSWPVKDRPPPAEAD